MLKSDQEKGEKVEAGRGESTKTVLIFFIFGCASYTGFSFLVTSAEDLMKGATLPTGLVWLAVSLPFLILPSTVPYVFDRVPALFWVLLLIPLNVYGILAIVLSNSSLLRITGVCSLGTAASLADVTAVCLTAFFHKVTVSAYCAGTGVAYIFGPLLYTAMTSWMQVSHRITVTTLAVLPYVFLVCYLLLENRRRDSTRYELILSNKHADDAADDDDVDDDSCNANDAKAYLSIKQKLRVTCSVSTVVLQIFLGIFTHDFVLGGVITSLAFPNAPLPPSEQYKYYLICSLGGLCIGRGYLGAADVFCPGLSDKLLVRNTWIIVLISIGHVIALILASWYRFIPSFWILLLLVFSIGFFAEAIYANLNVVIAEMEDSRARELSMGLAALGVGLGAVLGAILATPTEIGLVNHCRSITNGSQHCYTRNINMTTIVA